MSADFSRLKEEIREIESTGAEILHVDVMDGHFVPNITFGPPVVRSIRKVTDLYLDVHLMIEKPERFIDSFLDAGSDRLTIHQESTENCVEILSKLRKLGKGAGITIKPGTSVEKVLPLLKYVDLFLVMTVEPGFGGQKLIENCLAKIGAALEIRKTLGDDAFWIEVDGGINKETIKMARAAGSEIIVAGSAIFNASDRKQAYIDLYESAIKEEQ